MRLEGFPKLARLQCLHLNNNRVNRIARNLEGAPPTSLCMHVFFMCWW